jgi:hypothetical protein
MGADHYESFIKYQGRVIEELDRLALAFGFDTIDATRSVDEISDYLDEQVTAVLSGRGPSLVLPAGS